jgi:nitroreductase
MTGRAVVLTASDVQRVVEAAGRAPSVLNTQPWGWRHHVVESPRHSVLDLVADSARVLRVADPLGRFLVVSCGAALLNARLALRARGLDPQPTLEPDPDDARLLARLLPEHGAPPSAAEVALAEAIPERHTNRGPFADRRLTAALLLRLTAAAEAEGAALHVCTGAQAQRLLVIADEAADAARRDPRRAAELASWVHPAVAANGIPAQALGPPAAARGASVRDFDPERRLALGDPVAYEDNPTVAVLSTAGDARLDWLRAGQALQRVLLEATLDGVSASFRNEPLEMLSYRWRVRDATTGRGHPQMLLRLGFGAPRGFARRRPVSEVLQDG